MNNMIFSFLFVMVAITTFIITLFTGFARKINEKTFVLCFISLIWQAAAYVVSNTSAYNPTTNTLNYTFEDITLTCIGLVIGWFTIHLSKREVKPPKP